MPAAQSPYADLIDKTIWSNLSSMWSSAFNQDDRERINAIYEAAAQVLTAEMVKVAETSLLTSIADIPTFTQRRWLRLDLNKFSLMNDFLSFLSTKAKSIGTATASSDTLNCVAPATNHARHWHLTFPFTVPAGDVLTRGTLDLSYQLDWSLVAVWKMVTDRTTGETRGVLQRPGTDYGLLPAGTGILLTQPAPGDRYEITVGLDFSGTAYSEMHPVVTFTAGAVAPSPALALTDPTVSQANLPVHLLIVRDAPADLSSLSINTPMFSAAWEFYPWTGDSRGPQHSVTPGQVALPAGVQLSSSDIAFVFGIAKGAWDERHTHAVSTVVLNGGVNGAMARAGTATSVALPDYIPPGLAESLNGITQLYQVFINGTLLPRSEYHVDADGVIYLKTPLTWTATQRVELSVRYTDEFEVASGSTGDQHVHHQCAVEAADPPKVWARLDDGGDFDDEQGQTFDDTLTVNVLYLSDDHVAADSLEVFVNGILLTNHVDYELLTDQTTGRVRISFAINIAGKSVVAWYRREGRTFIYDFSAELMSVQETMNGFLKDSELLLEEFRRTHEVSTADGVRLVEAAQIAVAGGDPFLALFYDELPEHTDVPINAAGLDLSAMDARTVGSQDTRLVAIPVLVDHVLDPTVRLTAGVEFDVESSGIESSVDLLAKRSKDDAAPGVWWCPLVVLDERVVDKCFGAVVGDTAERSSDQHTLSVAANIQLRYTGPVFEDLQNTAAQLCGSPVFPVSGTITDIEYRAMSHVITLADDRRTQTVTLPGTAKPPSVGDTVIRSQSLVAPALISTTLTGLVSYNQGVLVAVLPAAELRPNDRVQLEIVDPADPSQTPFAVLLKLREISRDDSYDPIRTTLVFEQAPRFAPTAACSIHIVRDVGAPYAGLTGRVVAVDPVTAPVYVIGGSHRVALPVGAPTSWHIGQVVQQGRAVQPELARLYDSTSRPAWHWITAAEAQEAVLEQLAAEGQGGVSPYVPLERSASIYPPETAGGYSILRFDPAFPLVPPKTAVRFVSAVTGKTVRYTIIGFHGSDALVTPPVSGLVNGTATLELTEEAAYFETALDAKAVQAGTTTLAFDHAVRASAVQLKDTAGMPAAGEVVFRLASGGAFTVTYQRKANGYLLDCLWPATIEVLGTMSMVPADTIVYPIARFETRRLNPAFSALVSQRVDPAPVLDDATADQLFSLLAPNAAVIETRALSRPASLHVLLADVSPAHQSTVVMTRQVLTDTFGWASTDD